VITKVRAANPDVTFLSMFQAEAALLLQQAKEMDFKTTFMSGASLFNPQLIKRYEIPSRPCRKIRAVAACFGSVSVLLAMIDPGRGCEAFMQAVLWQIPRPL